MNSKRNELAWWVYCGNNKYQCSKCMHIIQHTYEPKTCPYCERTMTNAFIRMFPPNNAPQKKIKNIVKQGAKLNSINLK